MRRIIRVFPRRTSYTPRDELAFVGDPPLIRPEADEVHVSCCFNQDLWEARRLQRSWQRFYREVLLGGPAFDDQGGEFEPGLYVKRGITITSRGCPRSCAWCHVPRREGGLRLLEIKPGNIVNDNNLLACPESHIKAVFRMLEGQRRITFSGGLESRLLRDWQVEWLLKNRSRIKELWFAADYPSKTLWGALERVAHQLKELGRRKLRCYMLIGWQSDDPGVARSRLQRAWDLGFMPFAQFYQGPGAQPKTREWSKLQKQWSRPTIMKALNARKEKRC